MTRKIHDISLTVKPGIAVWPGDPGVVLERSSKIEDGNITNDSRMDMGVHTGTHVDAPWHFWSEGSTVETLDLNILTGPVLVVHLPDSIDVITAEVLNTLNVPVGTERLLFRTRNSFYWTDYPDTFQEDFVAIMPDCAEALVELGVRLVGIDYLSVAPFVDPAPTHRIMLKAGMILVEGLDLREVEAGNYMLYCLPLKLDGRDGAPARAILVEE